MLLAQRAVLREIPPGLAHEPDRRPFDLLAAAGAEEQVVHERASRAAAMVESTSSSVCAAERKPASNGDGAR